MKLNHFKFITLCSALVPICVACIVIFGWYTNNQSFVQIHPSFAPMQFNTAIGFLACGLGLLFLWLQKKPLSRILGLTAFTLGVITLLQYILQTDFGIDIFFVEPTFLTKTSHPGRMAPNTALCFAIYGITLLSSGCSRTLVIGTSIAIIILAVLSLLGYLIKYESLYGWGTLTRMALHTASCFLILGIGAVAFIYSKWTKGTFDFWQLTPSIISITVAILTIFSWYVIKEEAEARNAAHYKGLIDKTQDAVINRYALYEDSLRAGLGFVYASQHVNRQEWKDFILALKIESTLPGIHGVGYIDYVLEQDLENYVEQTTQDNAPNFNNHPETQYNDKFIIKYIEPIQKNATAIGLDIGFEKNRRAAAERARDLALPSLTQKIYLVQNQKKQPGFLLLIPTYKTKATPASIEQRRQQIKGWVYAPFIANRFFDGINKINNNQLTFEVYDGENTHQDNIIYKSAGNPSHSNADKTQQSINIAGQTWTLIWCKNENYSSPSNERFGNVFLIFGFLFASLLYFTLSRLIHSKRIISESVKKRTKELQDTEQSLLQANAELEEFAYRTSHDLRSPLVSSIALLDIVQESVQKDDKDTATTSIDHIRNSLKKLEDLIKDILALTETTNAEEERKTVDIEQIINDALKKFDNMENYKNLSITKHLGYENKLHVKANRLTLIIENLISNAIKYQDTSKDKSVLNIKTYGDHHQFALEIEDNGLGIPQDQQDNMFMMFKRFHNRVAFGSGLGLYMVKKSAQILNGDIFYKDNGNGTTFTLKIPVKET